MIPRESCEGQEKSDKLPAASGVLKRPREATAIPNLQSLQTGLLATTIVQKGKIEKGTKPNHSSSSLFRTLSFPVYREYKIKNLELTAFFCPDRRINHSPQALVYDEKAAFLDFF